MGDPAPGKAEVNMGGWIVRDHFPDGVAPASKILFDGAGTGTGIGFGASSFTTGIDMSSATISGDDIVLSASGVIMAATSLGFEIAGTSKLAITASGIKLDATVTLDDDGTIEDASNILTITQNTIKLVGGTAITLDGDTALDGAHTFTTGTGNVTIKGDLSIDAGIDFDMSDGAGTFATGTGNVTIKGDLSIDADKDFDMSAGAGTFATGTGAVSLDGDVTIAAGKTLYIRGASQSIASGSDNLMTLTSPTLTLAGSTKINLDGPTDVTGILTIDTAGSPADGIKISATTPADGLEISSACSANAINVSGASTTGLLIGGATTEAIDITGNATRAINIDTGAFTSGLTMSAAFSGNAISLTNSALTAGDNYSGVRVAVTAAAPTNAYGMAAYFDTTITGTTAGHCYGLGSWINTSSTPVLSASHIIVPLECGVYTGEAQASARIVLGQFQAILNGAPASLHVFRINTSQTTTAVFAAANAGSIGFASGAGTTSTKNGDIPLADVVGTGVVYVRTYDAAG
jgi:hypothetical protein